MTDERRSAERIDLLGTIHGDVLIVQATEIRQISLGGMLVETRFSLAVESLHDFRLVQRLDGSLGLAVRPSNAQASAHRALQRLLRSRGFAEPAISGRPWPVESSIDKRRRVRRER